MRNLMIKIQYNGANYCGWQKQPDSLGIQGTIEKAIFDITKEEVKITGSGRTDAGVHALGQVANFKLNSDIPYSKLPNALNSKLPKDISIIDCKEVDDQFHARYNAKGKRYRYLIYNSPYRNPIYKDTSYHVKYELDFNKMCKEAKSLIGTHDFKGFMSSGSSVIDTVRTIYDIEITKDEDMITIEVEGSGFLYNMVRIIVGTLVDIGRGRIKDNISEIIDSKSRSKTGHTAPAHGLFLKKVDY
ncbi:tRNA pseudouridine(38-40) synthase TruA [Romboutsia sp. 1001713B170207_170306_H8]|uniref:tRNA pseudouridine(38-40) synthase TruA n=1 Tax=Romboutsia sp. 1001713B170207_170306_H8 TaxID=2787112 RepID=UPI000821DE2B|nr:tRNA pseudouridine(38-40) synthase TruA [Romboutsia sp. 1001713B170207_170306_H8]SCI48833.1 tRNA pseudouridine synthase A [uncultured Clostridium sp.]